MHGSRFVGAAVAAATLAAGCGGEVAESSITASRSKAVEVPQVALPGADIPKYVDAVPTFSGKRIDATQTATVQMLEFQQKVLPASIYSGLAAPYDSGTYVWGYKVNTSGPSWPAYTLEARRYTATTAIYYNNLKQADGSPPVLAKYLTIDQTIHWADPLGTTRGNDCMMGPPLAQPCLEPYSGAIPAVVHLHGAEDLSYYDGHPDAWFTPDFQYTGPAFVTNTYNYNNFQEATTLWFHDHGLGITRLNVYSGLAGFYLLRDSRDTGYANNPVGLPAGAYEQELLIQDRQFDTNGQLLFPDGTPQEDPNGLNGPPTNPETHPYWVPEFFGDVMTVNGKSWPYLRVEPRRYRLRLLNGSNARFLSMTLIHQGSGKPGPAMWQIGSDGGLLDAPVKVSDAADPNGLELVLAPAERADVMVDFAGLKGKKLLLVNSANAPYPGGDPVDPDTSGQILQIRVNLALSGKDRSYNPAHPRKSLREQPIVKLDPAITLRPPDAKRQLVLDEVEGEGGPLMVLLNNTRWAGNRETDPPEPIPGSVSNGYGLNVTEVPRVGSTEVWEIVNLTEDAHPIHLHLIQFQVIEREAFVDPESYEASWAALFPGGTYGGVTYPPGVVIPAYGPPSAYSVPNGAGALGGNPDPTPFLSGTPVPAEPNERGWKDTVKVFPGTVTRIVARFAPQDMPVPGAVPGQNLYPFDATIGPGYVWHCHILDHEDNEMMRPYVLGK